jgi:hypothetical protein
MSSNSYDIEVDKKAQEKALNVEQEDAVATSPQDNFESAGGNHDDFDAKEIDLVGNSDAMDVLDDVCEQTLEEKASMKKTQEAVESLIGDRVESNDQEKEQEMDLKDKEENEEESAKETLETVRDDNAVIESEENFQTVTNKEDENPLYEISNVTLESSGVSVDEAETQEQPQELDMKEKEEGGKVCEEGAQEAIDNLSGDCAETEDEEKGHESIDHSSGDCLEIETHEKLQEMELKKEEEIEEERPQEVLDIVSDKNAILESEENFQTKEISNETLEISRVSVDVLESQEQTKELNVEEEDGAEEVYEEKAKYAFETLSDNFDETAAQEIAQKMDLKDKEETKNESAEETIESLSNNNDVVEAEEQFQATNCGEDEVVSMEKSNEILESSGISVDKLEAQEQPLEENTKEEEDEGEKGNH